MVSIYSGTPRRKGAASRTGLATRDFLLQAESAARSALAQGGLTDLNSRLRFSLLQLYEEDPTIHYEVWVQRRWLKGSGGRSKPSSPGGGSIEIGLHFEGPDARRNHALLQHMVGHGDSLMDVLGLRIEPEEWTPTWTRVHETIPLAGPLESPLAGRIGLRLAEWVRACQPVLAARTHR